MPSIQTSKGGHKASPHRLPIIHALEVDTLQALQDERLEPEITTECKEVSSSSSKLHPGNWTIQTRSGQKNDRGAKSDTGEEEHGLRGEVEVEGRQT